MTGRDAVQAMVAELHEDNFDDRDGARVRKGFDELRRERRRAADLITAQQAEIESLREALAASGDTKAAYMGEFSFRLLRTDENGDDYAEQVYVPWTTIKEIMAAIAARAALAGGSNNG